MAQPVLNCPRVVASVRQCVAASMPEHVGVNLEVEAGALTNALDQAINCIGRERAVPLRREDEAAVGELPAKLAQCADLVAAQRMN